MNNINRLFKYCEDFNDKYVNYKLFIFEYVLYLVHANREKIIQEVENGSYPKFSSYVKDNSIYKVFLDCEKDIDLDKLFLKFNRIINKYEIDNL